MNFNFFYKFIQIQTQISKVYLGMTFLAFGNSAGGKKKKFL
jgi:Ca2+/Na+ antiporter